MSDRNYTCVASAMQNKKDVFIAKAVNKHGNKFDYSLIEYVKSTVNVIIICKQHGEFIQTPETHLRAKYACPKCSLDSFTTSIDDFIKKSKELHNGFYSYKNIPPRIKNLQESVSITCPVHGDFKQKAYSHLAGFGCKLCANKKATNSTAYFIEKSVKIHGGKYDYSLADYKRSDSKIKIICPIHGMFEQLAFSHLAGAGCQKCSTSLNSWRRTSFQKFCNKHNKGDGILYVIKCSNKNECFYKIGITSKSVHKRMTENIMPYDYRVLYEIKQNGSYIFDLEKKLHSLLNDYAYMPNIEFHGYTECFSVITPIVKLLKNIQSIPQLQLIA